MPLAILEVMASSLPVIASDISGDRDLVSHGFDGIMRLMNAAGMRDESAGC